MGKVIIALFFLVFFTWEKLTKNALLCIIVRIFISRSSFLPCISVNWKVNLVIFPSLTSYTEGKKQHQNMQTGLSAFNENNSCYPYKQLPPRARMTSPQWLRFSWALSQALLRLAETTAVISLWNLLCFGTGRKPLIWLHLPSYHVDDGEYWLQKSLGSAFVCLAWHMQKLWFHIVLVRCRFYIPFLLPDQCTGKTTNLLGGLYKSLLFPNLFKFRVWNHCNKTTKAMAFTDKLKPLL